MSPVRHSLSALMLSSAMLAGGPALAADEAVATANTGQPGVGAQIDEYLRTSPAIALPKDNAGGITSSTDEPRQVHGVVDVAVGSHGYRSAYVRSDFPLGKTGTLSVAVEDTQFKGRFGGYGYGYGGYGDQTFRNQNVAVGLAFGGAGTPAAAATARAAPGAASTRRSWARGPSAPARTGSPAASGHRRPNAPSISRAFRA